MNELKDIKDIVEVQEHSFVMLMSVILLAVVVVALATYLFKNRRKRRKKPTAKEIALERLQNIDYSNTKEVVYLFEEQGEMFLNEKNQVEFESIKEELKIYKYKKDIPPLDRDIEERIKAFIKELK